MEKMKMNNLGTNPVLDFAKAMQIELDNNSNKGDISWRQDCSLEYLLKRLDEEVEEIREAVHTNKPAKKILSECADVGNFVMMIADIYEQRRK